uniref:Uncharacterized protein n=1 Tax=Coccolithus braarudii TaxID=221442 RepID=A0A7S0LJX6_9EUKA|mmetsp:Transcript_42311/g.90308  ORF Transcript_42311/g.90308 Transcript_42311/m.90308 type:complete len:117 (+) Transcript_42311:397-747(+)
MCGSASQCNLANRSPAQLSSTLRSAKTIRLLCAEMGRCGHGAAANMDSYLVHMLAHSHHHQLCPQHYRMAVLSVLVHLVIARVLNDGMARRTASVLAQAGRLSWLSQWQHFLLHAT